MNAVLIITIFSFGLFIGCNPIQTENSGTVSSSPSQALINTNAIQNLNKQEVHFDKTVFNNEVKAQTYESTFVALWDKLRSIEPFTVFR